jgi:hypothetical protein
VGTGYPIHISHGPSVKAASHRLSHRPVICEHFVRRGRQTQVPLVLFAQLR